MRLGINFLRLVKDSSIGWWLVHWSGIPLLSFGPPVVSDLHILPTHDQFWCICIGSVAVAQKVVDEITIRKYPTKGKIFLALSERKRFCSWDFWWKFIFWKRPIDSQNFVIFGDTIWILCAHIALCSIAQETQGSQKFSIWKMFKSYLNRNTDNFFLLATSPIFKSAVKI